MFSVVVLYCHQFAHLHAPQNYYDQKALYFSLTHKHLIKLYLREMKRHGINMHACTHAHTHSDTSVHVLIYFWNCLIVVIVNVDVIWIQFSLLFSKTLMLLLLLLKSHLLFIHHATFQRNSHLYIPLYVRRKQVRLLLSQNRKILYGCCCCLKSEWYSRHEYTNFFISCHLNILYT